MKRKIGFWSALCLLLILSISCGTLARQAVKVLTPLTDEAVKAMDGLVKKGGEVVVENFRTIVRNAKKTSYPTRGSDIVTIDDVEYEVIGLGRLVNAIGDAPDDVVRSVKAQQELDTVEESRLRNLIRDAICELGAETFSTAELVNYVQSRSEVEIDAAILRKVFSEIGGASSEAKSLVFGATDEFIGQGC